MFDYQSLSPRAGEQEFVVERQFAAPRALLFQVFTQPEHLKRWWAPQPFTIPKVAVDMGMLQGMSMTWDCLVGYMQELRKS